MKKSKKLIGLTVVAIIVVLTIGDPQLFIIPCFLISWILTPEATSKIDSVSDMSFKKKVFIQLSIIGLFSGLLTEFFAILSNLNVPPEQRALFLPDPLLDMIVSVAYYLPISLAIATFLVKYEMDIKWVFIAGGIYGILTEQNSAIFFSFSLVFWLYVALVYGSFIALPAAVMRSKLTCLRRKQKRTLVLTAFFVITLIVTFMIFARLLMALFLILLGIPF